MTATHVRTQYYLLELTELIPSVELVLNVNQITQRIELELELMPKNHQNPSPDSDPALELIQPYCPGLGSAEQSAAERGPNSS